ncbi:MAG: methyltransferase domain-containing protein [bacterium]
MKEILLNYLCCPGCQSEFRLEIFEKDGPEIIFGKLICVGCGKEYFIRNAVPRIVDEVARDKEKTAEGFSYEWQHFKMLTDKYKAQFLDWIYPVREDFFPGKIILDAGCGKGRHIYWSAKFGAREVIGIDLGETVKVAYKNTKDFPNVHIIQADIYRLPFRKDFFDYIYSIGVLHHLPDPGAGFTNLVKHLKQNGTISAWVYGREGNNWIIYILNPLRIFFTSRLPLGVLKIVSFFPALVLQILVKLVYRPVNEIKCLSSLKKFFFYNDYLYSISGFSFKENYSIVFDHLLAPTAFYLRRDELEDWFKKNNLSDIIISWRNKNSWRGKGVK